MGWRHLAHSSASQTVHRRAHRMASAGKAAAFATRALKDTTARSCPIAPATVLASVLMAAATATLALMVSVAAPRLQGARPCRLCCDLRWRRGRFSAQVPRASYEQNAPTTAATTACAFMGAAVAPKATPELIARNWKNAHTAAQVEAFASTSSAIAYTVPPAVRTLTHHGCDALL